MTRFLLLSTRADDAAAVAERQSFLRHGGLAQDALVQVRVEQAPLPPIDPREWDGILLGGSPYNSTDLVKTQLQQRVEGDLVSLVRRVLDAGTPFFGACYGIGVVGLATDAVVDTTYAEPPGAVAVQLTHAGRDDPLLAGVPDLFHGIVGHKEACSTLPTGGVLLGRGASCPVQLYRLGERVWVTQFHPDLDQADFATRLRHYKHAGYCAPDEAEDLIAAAAHHDLSHSHRLLANFVALHAGSRTR